jgi:hypothetical protein
MPRWTAEVLEFVNTCLSASSKPVFLGASLQTKMMLRQEGTIMESIVVNSSVRELCEAVSQEENSEQMMILVDELIRVLDERQPSAEVWIKQQPERPGWDSTPIYDLPSRGATEKIQGNSCNAYAWHPEKVPQCIEKPKSVGTSFANGLRQSKTRNVLWLWFRK